MSNHVVTLGPRAKARIAGVFEAVEGLTSGYSQVGILGRMIVSGSAAATASNILAHEPLLRLGFALSLVGVICHLVWALLFYDLLKVVHRGVARCAVFVVLICCALQAIAALFYLAPLAVLQGGSALEALNNGQLQGIAFVLLKLNGIAFNANLVFFGLWCVLSGYLIGRSTFLPRVLGALLMIDGLGWMMYIAPPLANHIFPIIAGASAVAELPLQLWLIIFGVNDERWNAQARRQA